MNFKILIVTILMSLSTVSSTVLAGKMPSKYQGIFVPKDQSCDLIHKRLEIDDLGYDDFRVTNPSLEKVTAYVDDPSINDHIEQFRCTAYEVISVKEGVDKLEMYCIWYNEDGETRPLGKGYKTLSISGQTLTTNSGVYTRCQ